MKALYLMKHIPLHFKINCKKNKLSSVINISNKNNLKKMNKELINKKFYRNQIRILNIKKYNLRYSNCKDKQILPSFYLTFRILTKSK